MTNNCNYAQPLSQSQDIRTPNLFSLNYTNQDFWSLKQRLVLFIQQNFPDDFNDFVESSLAIMLIENWAFLADTLSFKMDQIVNELFIGTVTEVENAFRLAELVGFQPTPPIAASASFSMTLGSLLSVDMVIPVPVEVSVAITTTTNSTSTTSSTTYEIFNQNADGTPDYTDNIIIPAGSFSNTALIGVEGITRIEQFSGTGQSNQSYQLTESPVIYGTISVSVNGVGWQLVDYFTDSQQRLEFMVSYDSNYNAFVMFGDAKAGLQPSNGSIIQIRYRVGGGQIGNIVSGAINTSLPFLVPGMQITIPVAITNYTAGQYGYNGDGIEDIRRKLPAYIRTQNRIVTGGDLQTLSNQFVTTTNGQVAMSTAALRNYGCSGNIIDLFILANGGMNTLQTASDGLKEQLSTYLSQYKMMTDYICIKDGEILSIDVQVDLNVNSFFQKFNDEIITNATNQINNYFALANLAFGQDLQSGDIVQTLASVREIERSTITFINPMDPNNAGSMVTPLYYQVIVPDLITINITYD